MRKTKSGLAALALAGMSLLASQAAFADGITMQVESLGGLKVFNPEDDHYWFAIGGRLHTDLVMFSGSRTARQMLPSGTNIRRASLFARGGLGCHFSYQVGLDLETGAASTTFQESFLAYDGFKNLWLAVGQVSVPISMENWTSGNNTTFMENALPVAALASPSPAIGVFMSATGDILAGSLAVVTLGDEVPASVLPATGGFLGSDPLTVAGRLHFSPVHTQETVYHFGVSGMFSDLHNKHNQLAFTTRPEMRARSTPSISTAIPGLVPGTLVGGAASGVANSFNTLAAEIAGKWGPLSGQAEYITTRVNATGGDFSFNGYYAQAAYVLTGETRDYDFKSGTFGRVKPDSRIGAWELAARYSYVGLRNRNFGAGSESNATLGLNWWVNSNVRFTANYVKARLPAAVPGTPFVAPVGTVRRVDIWGLRAQANW